MNSLEFVKEMEQLKDICNRVWSHLKQHQMTIQGLKWDADNLQEKIYQNQQTLRDLEVQQEQAKATAEAIIAKATERAQAVDVEFAAIYKTLQDYEHVVIKREERFEKTKYLS